MAKMLPPYVDRSCKSSGEKQLFELFKNSPFCSTWTVLHSLNLSQHTVRLYGEIDFLVMVPNWGVFVIEVKAGDVKCVEGEWYFIDRYRVAHKGKSPFAQAQDAMFSLQRAIHQEFVRRRESLPKLVFGFLCVFPHISFDKYSPEYEPWQILDQDGLQSGADKFFNTFLEKSVEKCRREKWFTEASLPSNELIQRICDFLRGDFERVRTIEERLKEFSRQVKKYTEEQFRILDSIQLNNRSVIQGSAGTGKTMIAMESAVRSASLGRRVFLTCFNRLIGEWMQAQLSDWSDSITVSSLHSFLIAKSKGFGYDQQQGTQHEFFSAYLPGLLRDIYQKGIAQKFDHLIIDEGQDLITPEYLDLFDSMLLGGLNEGRWELYGDFERQAIYAQVSRKVMFDLLNKRGPYSNFLLTTNCRNTKQIGEETSRISGFEKPPFLLDHLEGIPVQYVFYKNAAEQNKMLADELASLVRKEIPFSELVLLAPKRFDLASPSSLAGHSVKEIKDSGEIHGRRFFGFATVQAFKGMESSYVIITDVEDLTSEAAKSLMYVGMSRARYGLIVLISEARRDDYRSILLKKL